MLKKRIIPVLLHYKSWLVKTKKFDDKRNVGNLQQMINVFKDRKLDELALIDLMATSENKNFNFNILDEIASECNMPLIIGGGIKNLHDVETAFKKGADKIIVGSAGIKNNNFLDLIVKNFGSQSLMAAIDIKKINNKHYVFIDNGKTKVNTSALGWIQKVQDLGAGELLITSIDFEGTMNGYDYLLLKKIEKYIKVPLIFNGGAGKTKDFTKLLLNKKIMGACASSVFLFTEITPKIIKHESQKKKIKLRC
tara:strand:- start:4284 stop:5039 length:756 start_codon:yes stop_codon:yes gene_type:complete